MAAFACSPGPAPAIKGKVNIAIRRSEKIPPVFCKLGIFINSPANGRPTNGVQMQTLVTLTGLEPICSIKRRQVDSRVRSDWSLSSFRFCKLRERTTLEANHFYSHRKVLREHWQQIRFTRRNGHRKSRRLGNCGKAKRK
jgi:hypothetical protein